MYETGYGVGGLGAAELILICALAFGLAVAALVGFLLYRALDAVPAEHRRMEPWQVFLLFIPCFGIFWSFMVFTRIPQSYRSYFTASGDPDPTGSLEQMGLAYAILTVVTLIPYLGGCFWLIGLGVLIFYLVQVSRLRTSLLMHLAGGGGRPPTTF